MKAMSASLVNQDEMEKKWRSNCLHYKLYHLLHSMHRCYP